MGQDPGASSAAVTGGEDPAVTGGQDPAEIERDIAQTREELGDTVEALAQKADVKAQAKQKVEATRASVAEKKEQLLGKAKEASPDSGVTAAGQASQKARENPLPVAAAAAFAFGFIAGRVTKG